jgi:hypothetical protein
MDAKFDPTFYSTVAQVLPVLLVVVFVELLLARERDSFLNLHSGGPFVLSALALALGAEFVCLQALKEARPPSELEDAVVVMGLVWPGFVLVTVVLRPIAEAISRSRIGAGLLLLYFLGAVAGFFLFAMDVVPLSTWLVGASVAPACEVAVFAIADMVPSRMWTRDRRRRDGSQPRKPDKESLVVEPAGAGPAPRHDQGGRWRRLLLLAVLLLVAASDVDDD